MKLAVLTSKGRKHIAPSNFVFPKDKRYPIHDISHARNALARSSGKPEEAKVKAAVYKKYPSLKTNKVKAAEPVRAELFTIKPLLLRLTENDEGIQVPNRIQLFRTGQFKKIQPDGSTIQFAITRETLSEIVQNFNDKVRGVDLALDFAHKSDEEAAGWFKSLYIEEAGGECQLWAEIDWTPDGRASVASKKFRYISPDFAFAWSDNETGQKYGATLFGAGLTNRPVIKNMTPTVELTEVKEMAKKAAKKKISEMSKEELEVRLAEEKDEEKKELIQLRLDEMSEDDDSDDGDSDEDEDDGDEDDGGTTADSQKKKAKPDKKGKSDDDSDDMNLEELKAAYQKQCKEMADLKKGMAKALAETQKKEKEAKFSVLCSEGKAVPAQKDAFMKDDMVKFAELAEPVKFETMGAYGAAVTKNGKSKTPASDEVVKLAEKAWAEKKVEKRADAVSYVLSENPELAERYHEEMETVQP